MSDRVLYGNGHNGSDTPIAEMLRRAHEKAATIRGEPLEPMPMSRRDIEALREAGVDVLVTPPSPPPPTP